MIRPERLWQQYEGKAVAELMRGSGIWPLKPHPCDLEPPWESYDRRSLTRWDCGINGWEAPWEGGWLRRLLAPRLPVHCQGEAMILPEQPCPTNEHLVPVIVEQFTADETTIPKAEQFLLALPTLRRHVSFEILGIGPQPEYDDEKLRKLMDAGRWRRMDEAISGWTKPTITAQFVCDRADAAVVRRQLIAHYPNSAVVLGEQLTFEDKLPGEVRYSETFGGSLALHHFYCQPLRTYGKLDPDPLGVAIAGMEHLGEREWALVQILFQPAYQPWSDTVEEAVRDPYGPGKYLFTDVSDKLLRQKFASRLFAVAVHLASNDAQVFQQLEGWAEQFAAPPQGFFVNQSGWEGPTMPDDERDLFAWSVEARCTHRPGMLLNLQELASLVHLPAESVVSDRLRRVTSRTRPVVVASTGGRSMILGENTHRGETKVASIPTELRSRHCYVAGASGTGKSTLLLNTIVQDIQAGHGVGLLDPHGDLVQAVLKRIPENRLADVILFDPADEEYPFALNILEAKDEAERERIVQETVMSLERYFPSSWGPRLERILTYTIHTVLHAVPGATLADVERMLTDEAFRKQVLGKTKDPRFLQFWHQQFKFFPKNASDPVLNKLSVFLMSRTVRNIICQRHSAIDFDKLLNERKILLANLSTGLLTEKIAGTFGSFLVTKIVNAAFRRARLPEHQRQPWYLYVDEFQAFMNLSVGFDRILAEARKYNLVLAGLANQYVGQLSPQVRQAIFGNVGVFVTFRLGVDDANLVQKELGVFTAEEIMNLERGQAIARVGGSSTAFNLRTYPEPAVEARDPSASIIAATRTKYARPRHVVERDLSTVAAKDVEREQRSSRSPPPTDPNEDDLISDE